ncbi:hypothetical protein HQQ94_12670 [Shewanella sp. VB17]|uniref:hypothetical protein n=1 Tax=Shewanella sp. VB17 TaxID=2739432 RepID=UPI001563D223|nr:hypothetical protein [Shewanella sp. VB17]NRD74073.1 hypothetical protein [Shewanella sp. VB17]
MQTTHINLAISAEKLAKLIQSGDVCAADFRCLDQASKQKVWQLCLLCCSNRVGCLQSCNSSCAGSECNSSDPSINSQQVGDIMSAPNKWTNII